MIKSGFLLSMLSLGFVSLVDTASASAVNEWENQCPILDGKASQFDDVSVLRRDGVTWSVTSSRTSPGFPSHPEDEVGALLLGTYDNRRGSVICLYAIANSIQHKSGVIRLTGITPRSQEVYAVTQKASVGRAVKHFGEEIKPSLTSGGSAAAYGQFMPDPDVAAQKAKINHLYRWHGQGVKMMALKRGASVYAYHRGSLDPNVVANKEQVGHVVKHFGEGITPELARGAGADAYGNYIPSPNTPE